MNYEKLDTPQILQYIYYPRRDTASAPAGSRDIKITVDETEQVQVACRFYEGSKEWPVLIYFHGNGEVASDYDDIAELYTGRKINLLVVDYRGYGKSSGAPTISSQLHDAVVIYRQLLVEVKERGYTGKVFVMGRSMGSLSAQEIVFRAGEELPGLIIESGFCCVSRLIKLFNLPADREALEEVENAAIECLHSISLPVLVIHGEWDSLVPLAEGQLIYDSIQTPDKQMLVIPRATHNDIIFRDIDRYFGAIEAFVHGQQKEIK